MANEHGLDTQYFTKWMKKVLRDIELFKPDEFARQAVRMAVVADHNILDEEEFSPWVAVESRLPEESGIYMACSVDAQRDAPKDFIDSFCHFNAEAEEGESKWQHSSGFYDNAITHWMDVPKRPVAN